MERVTRKQSKIARQYAHKLLKELHEPMKDKYSFITRLVGSGAWNTIIKDVDGWWDAVPAHHNSRPRVGADCAL